MILFVYYLLQQLVSLILLQLLLLQSTSAQWITVAEFSMRVPGRCASSGAAITGGTLGTWEQQHQFDCGGSQQQPQLQQLRCIPLRRFHDGIADCPDGSDEFCFPGYVKCGSYCVSPQYTAQCFVNPRCDNSPTSPTFCDVTKEKLCPVGGTVPCKGYGECVMRKWIEQGLTNCIDKSDEDPAYIAVFGIKRGTSSYPGLHIFTDRKSSTEIGGATPAVFPGATDAHGLAPNWLQRISSSSSPPSAVSWTEIGRRISNGSVSGTTTEGDTSNGTVQGFSDTFATTEPTSTRFVFRVPENGVDDQDFGPTPSGTDTEMTDFTSTAVPELQTINPPSSLNHYVPQNSQNLGRNTEQYSSNNFQNFGGGGRRQGKYGTEPDSRANSIYLSQFTTAKPNGADFSTGGTAIGVPGPPFIYPPGGSSTEQSSEKMNFLTVSATSTTYNWPYEKLNGTKYGGNLTSIIKSASTQQSASRSRGGNADSNFNYQQVNPQSQFQNRNGSVQNKANESWTGGGVIGVNVAKGSGAANEVRGSGATNGAKGSSGTSSIKGTSDFGAEQKYRTFQQQQQHGATITGAQVPLEHRGALQGQGNSAMPNGTLSQSIAIIGSQNLLSNPQHGTFAPNWTPSQSAATGGTTELGNGAQQILPPVLVNAPRQQGQQYGKKRPISGTVAVTVTTTTPSADQVACARYEYAEAQRLVPDPWCTCPPGQMPDDDGVECKATTVSTFGIDMQDMCAGMQIDPEERARLAILVLSRAQLPYLACVRRDGQPVMIQLDCSHCTAEELEEAFKVNARDHYIPLHVEELSLGACLAPTLNDCDPDHADCLVDGPRYRCRCHEGWNDTSKEIGKAKGRRCEQLILLADGCIPFLGICLLWWFLLLGIILFLLLPLLCCAGYWLYKWCLRRNRVATDEQGRLIVSEAASVNGSNPIFIPAETSNTHSDSIITHSSSATRGKATTTVETTESVPETSGNKGAAVHDKVFVKQKTAKSLDTWRKRGETMIDERKRRLKTRSAKSEQAINGAPESERQERARHLAEIFGNHAGKVDLPTSAEKKLKEIAAFSEPIKDTEVPVEPPRNLGRAAVVAVVAKKDIAVPEVPKAANGQVVNSVQNGELPISKTAAEEDTKQVSNNKIEKKASQSSSEASLRTMWELFKHSAWKQSSRPSSIKSSTPSLDRLIDVFLCRTANKIHPVTTTNGNEFPLKPVDSTVVTSATITSSVTTTPSAVATAAALQSLGIGGANIAAQPSTPAAPVTAQVQTQVLEQKIVTEMKTLTTTSTVPLLPGEIPSAAATATTAPQPLHPITTTATTTTTTIATATFNRSESVQTDDELSIQSALSAGATVPVVAEEESDGAGEQQSPAVTDNAALVQDQVPAVSDKGEAAGTNIIRPSTTTIVTSSDALLKRRASAVFPVQNMLRKTQSEHGGRLLMVPREEAREKSPPTAEELREALKKVASMKPPTKRLTEKQKEKLSASCEHLQAQNDGEGSEDKGGGSIGQLLAATSGTRPRYEPRRKLSSISEKSAEMGSGGDEVVPAPSSVSCPTTTRISKDHKRLPSTLQKYRDGTYGTRNRVFADLRAPLVRKSTKLKGETEAISSAADKSMLSSLMDGDWGKMDQDRVAAKTRRRNVDGDTGGWRQRPISVVDARPPWDSSPLKEGELDRIAPLQPVFPRHYQHRKWLSTSHLDHVRNREHAHDAHRRRSSDWNLHEASRARAAQLTQLHPRLPFVATLRGTGGGVQWTPPNATQDSNRPIKEQLWWGGR